MSSTSLLSSCFFVRWVFRVLLFIALKSIVFMHQKKKVTKVLDQHTFFTHTISFHRMRYWIEILFERLELMEQSVTSRYVYFEKKFFYNHLSFYNVLRLVFSNYLLIFGSPFCLCDPVWSDLFRFLGIASRSVVVFKKHQWSSVSPCERGT